VDRLERFYKIDQLLKERKVVSFALFPLIAYFDRVPGYLLEAWLERIKIVGWDGRLAAAPESPLLAALKELEVKV
jgi:hypothetical protein